MPGHIFIVPGDVRKLACDAWLIPCSRQANPNLFLPDHLQDPDATGRSALWPTPPPSDPWRTWGRRVLRADRWPEGEPQAWLVNVAYTPESGQTEDEFYRTSIHQALVEVFASLRGRAPRNRRQVPLVAMPFLGGGRGMPMVERGRLLRRLLRHLQGELQALQDIMDLVLVTFAAEELAAAQHERLELGEDWPELESDLQAEAKRLANLGAQGSLALFLGAGIGVGAGLPTWNELLEEIARKAGIDQAEIESLLDKRRDVRDQASYLESRLGEPERLHEAVRSTIEAKRHHYSLCHALLAGLPSREAITTNYDQLFETAWEAAASKMVSGGNREVTLRTSVIPHRREPNHDRWLLKLHGCVTKPGSIVLTRESYIRFSSQWAALEGILQATLLTRHMLFVGFSLRDDNFIRILDAVRRIVRPPSDSPTVCDPFGTALMMGQDRVMQKLYHDDLAWVAMSDHDELQMEGKDFSGPGRRLEMFLDCLLAHTRSPTHLLDEEFQSLLTEDEMTLSGQLARLADSVPAAPDRSPAWERVEDFLRGFGWRRAERSSWKPRHRCAP